MNASLTALTAAARANDPQLRVAAAYHPSLPQSLRLALADDPEPSVRDAASNALLYNVSDLAIAYALTQRLATPPEPVHRPPVSAPAS